MLILLEFFLSLIVEHNLPVMFSGTASQVVRTEGLSKYHLFGEGLCFLRSF